MNKQKILIVEDEEGIGSILKDILEKNNYDVVWVKDGKEGYERAMIEEFELIILDINLPKMDGFEICRRIKAHPLGDLIPIIILTVRRELPDKLKGLGLGADDYITKPFEIDELLERIKTTLKRKEKYLERHPVTRLPSYFNLFEEYKRYRGKDFYMIYGKLDDIMNYALAYDYNRAVELIKRIAEFLKSEVEKIFHINGIQFFLILPEKETRRKVERIIKNFPEVIKEFYKEEEIKRGYVVVKNGGTSQIIDVVKFHMAVVTLRDKKDYNFKDIVETLFYLYKLVYDEPSLAVFENGEKIYSSSEKKKIVFFSKSQFFLNCFKGILMDDGWDVEVSKEFKIKDEYKNKDFFLIDFDDDFANKLKERFRDKRVLLLSHSPENILFEISEGEKINFSPDKLGIKTASLIKILFKEVEI